MTPIQASHPTSHILYAENLCVFTSRILNVQNNASHLVDNAPFNYFSLFSLLVLWEQILSFSFSSRSIYYIVLLKYQHWRLLAHKSWWGHKQFSRASWRIWVLDEGEIIHPWPCHPSLLLWPSSGRCCKQVKLGPAASCEGLSGKFKGHLHSSVGSMKYILL